MYLKRIEIQGFKSFANKIVFEFHNGITGIVGPNGSGKSNVSDAVRWVLGEQSARQLRGGNMQDVIFAGTQLRRPLGFAYVAITLDNKDGKLAIDFQEVTVSRRIFRSGESEYRINGSPCRLKDISELFYDTGIGKDGYSIIGQGQVERILSAKPEERRELFDEAAGITKFKRRKAEAIKKLEAEQNSLVRVNDILSELEKQVGPLKKQADTARRYLDLRNSLKSYDVNLFLMETEGFNRDLSEIGKKEGILEGDLKDARSSLEKSKTEYEAMDQAVKKLEEQSAALQKAREEKVSGLQEERAQMARLEEQIRLEGENKEAAQKQRERLGADIAAKKKEGEELQAQQNETQAQLLGVQQKEEQLFASRQDKDEALRRQEEALEALKHAAARNFTEHGDVKAKGERLQGILEQIRLRKSETAQKLLKMKTQQEEFGRKIQEERRAIEHQEEGLKALEAEIAQREENRKNKKQERDSLAELVSKTQVAYQSDSARLDSLKNIAERYDGYGNAIRRVMEARDRIFGIHGVVADIITTQKGYETAIETALGGRIQNIVTDSEATAKALIEYLKKNKYGRATFLPLSSIKGQKWQEEALLSEPGVLGTASSLVRTKEAYEKLVENLLGRILVVDHIDHAIALEKKYHYELRVVTLEGESFSPGGAISGGAFKNAGNLLGRKREIEELSRQVEATLKKYSSLNMRLQEAREGLAALTGEIEVLQAKRQEILLEQNNLRHDFLSWQEKEKEFARELLGLKGEYDKLTKDGLEVEEEQAQLSKVLEEAAREAKHWEREIKAMEEKIQGDKSLQEADLQEKNRLSLHSASLRQRADFQEENLTRNQRELEKLEKEEDALLESQKKLESSMAEKRQSMVKRREMLSALETAIQEMEARQKQLGEEKNQKNASQKKIFENRDFLNQRVGLIEKDLYRLRTQRERAEEKLTVSSNYMWNEYELTYNRCLEFKADLGNEGELKARVKLLKEEIKGLGNVNVNAISDYTELSQRFDTMEKQHRDILQAEEQLVQIIAGLDEGMRRQFTLKFGEIAGEFDHVFKELFGGGSGKLELEEGEDLLEASVSIIAQPPGKKLQNMMQLSGGEKALTAISLLFAIQNLKPSPFALLDEIEAALDDSNVDRFARYLHKLKDHTQFIVITHRRGTMVSADRLYGITMQEKGVSALVSVNLIEEDLED